MEKTKFLFKDDLYEFRELFSMYLTGKNLFKSGDVTNIITGECFDISEICEVKNRYRHLLEDSVNNIGNMHDRRIKWAIENEEKEKRYMLLKNLYEKDSITIEELKEYIDLKSYFDKDFLKGRKLFSIKYEEFIILNISEPLPRTVKFLDQARFYNMIYFLSYDGILKHTARKNGKVIKKEELMSYLEIKDYSVYRKYISTLLKNNIIKEIPTTNKTKVIIINPIYANRNIRIDYTTYLTFKSDISKYLTEEEIQLIEKIGNKDELVGSYEID